MAQSVITLIAASSGGAQANNVTLPANPNLVTYITGFDVGGLGATTGTTIAVTLTGTNSAVPPTWNILVPTGAGLAITPTILQVRFTPPIPGVDINTAITVNVPSFGAGNTSAFCVAWGMLM